MLLDCILWASANPFVQTVISLIEVIFLFLYVHYAQKTVSNVLILHIIAFLANNRFTYRIILVFQAAVLDSISIWLCINVSLVFSHVKHVVAYLIVLLVSMIHLFCIMDSAWALVLKALTLFKETVWNVLLPVWAAHTLTALFYVFNVPLVATWVPLHLVNVWAYASWLNTAIPELKIASVV